MTAGAAVETVEQAAAAAPGDQPYGELGLSEEEYLRIRAVLGRRPTASELAMYGVLWSEHCSYKSSKVHLRQFAAKAPAGAALLVGIGENAGVVDVGQGLAVTFKVESHNHPSFVEPYQGAATGVGGIVRDILTMGARPIAVLDSLRFGPAGAADTRRLLPGVVAGVGGYGNCLGLPNVGGELGFDPSYSGNPLVNALCVGVLPADGIQLARATGPGNQVVLIGALTGRDGIGGASVLASATFDGGGVPAKRPSVQVGDPFTEKLLIECCLELYARGLVTGIQDLGAAGLACATSETASHGGSGMRVSLERVPLREASMSPPEILVSESQERMLAIAEPGRVEELLAVCRRWGALATVIGDVTDTGRLVISWHGATVVDVPPASLADDGPVYERPWARPAEQDALVARALPALDPDQPGEALRGQLLELLASPELCSRRWVTEQYDRYVQGNTVLAMPADAGVVRLDEASLLGIAISLDGNGRYCRLDPYVGAQLVLAEAYRNVAVTGARPVAVTDCLNFGSPEDPAVMWQFVETVRGLADGCRELGTPVTGGNVSFYNQTGTQPIHPTPVIGVLGVIDDVTRRTGMGLRAAGDLVFLLGRTREELGGSAWAWQLFWHLGGRPPVADLPAERALATVLGSAARNGLARSAHDLSEGGLAQGLAEMVLHGGLGARVRVGPAPGVALFSESSARALVAVAPQDAGALQALCTREGVPCAELGVVEGDALEVVGEFTIPITELRAAHEGTLPRLFGA
ncbi:MAG TPA: phosphoribosylformylglycinamidine synthase subunit PurL [Mycobacteriales bacterium]|nr:phosphoribosylformylglycinamidine synthase subunit PurL [Mycobacteriales bacterium]